MTAAQGLWYRDFEQRGQAMTEHLLLTACIALVLLVPLAESSPGTLLARAVVRFARAFIAVMAWS